MKALMALLFVFIIGLCVLAGYGWIANIVKFARLDFQAPVKAEVLRGVGIVVAPMGVIEGFINISD